MFPTTPFPANMDFYSPYYWNSATYSWVPNPFYTTPYYPNAAPFSQWNVAPATTNYSYSYRTGYHAQPYPTLNQASYNSYVNYFATIPNCNPIYNPAQFPGNMPMPPPPMPAAPTTLALPAPPPMPAAPSPPSVPAVQVKKEPTPVDKPVKVKEEPSPVVKLMKVKEEPVEDTPRICSNCKTTDASEYKNVISKGNILCKTCFDYRRTHKKDRPTMKIHVKKEMKAIKSE